MLEGLAPDLPLRLTIAIGGVAVAFLALIAVLVFLKRRNSPLFVKGGRARDHRLVVMDAAAVDAKRRLVLIKRDDTEHLIMIGGPTDIVIETGIGAPATQRTAAETRAVDVVAPNREARRREIAAPDGEVEQPRRQQRQEQAAVQAQRPAPARLTEQAARNVSSMGAVLYDEDREPMMSAPPVNSNASPIEANDLLDQARSRVFSAAPQQSPANRQEDAIRALEEQLEASKAEAARQEAEQAEAARRAEEQAEAARIEAERAERQRVEAARAEAARAEAIRAEAARREAQRAEAARQEAERQEAQRRQAEAAEAERQEQARLEAERQEQARIESEQAEEQLAEAARQEAERAEAQRMEAEREEAERTETARMEAERAEAERVEAERQEAERIAAARTEAMARFEAARRAQAEQQQQFAQPQVVEQAPVPEAYREHAMALSDTTLSPDIVSVEDEDEILDEKPADTEKQERLASDFEKLLEAELEADGVLDYRPTPVSGDQSSPYGTPAVNPVQRDAQPITGAVPGISIEQDMARRLGEISLNKKADAL